MPRPIRHRSRSENPARRVFETIADRQYLEARIARLGGKGGALLKVEVPDTGPGEPWEYAEYTVRQGVDRADLPSVIQRVLSGDLLIERTESWRRTAPGSYDGTVHATVAGAPGNVTGTLRLADVADIGDGRPGSELTVNASAQMPIPLIGGKIEAVIAEHVERIVNRETEFALRWIAGS